MADFVIRPYQGKDREAIRKIAFDTAFMGEPAEVFFTDQEVLADILTDYFTDHEPESLFVAESGGAIVGYLLGAKDSARVSRIFIKIIRRPCTSILPPGIGRAGLAPL